MKIFVAGGSGRVATELIKNLVAAGHQVIAGARSPQNIVTLSGVTPVKLDLASATPEDIAELMADATSVYFVAGSRGQDLLQVDAFGAVKVMQAAQAKNIQRFILLSSIYALQPNNWHQEGLSEIMDYNVAKFFADTYLINNTNLNYTILQPTRLVEGPATGKINVTDAKIATNTIADVATVLADLLKYDNTGKKVIMMQNGDIPIAKALAEI